MLTLELHFDELGTCLHLAFEDETFAKFVVSYPIARFILLAPGFNRFHFLRHRRYRWRNRGR